MVVLVRLIDVTLWMRDLLMMMIRDDVPGVMRSASRFGLPNSFSSALLQNISKNLQS